MKQNKQNEFKNIKYFQKIAEHYKKSNEKQIFVFMLNTACMFAAITSNTLLLKLLQKFVGRNKLLYSIGYFSRYNFKYLFQLPLKDYFRTQLYGNKSTKHIYGQIKQSQPLTLSQIISYNMLCGSSIGLVNCLIGVRIRPKQDLFRAEDARMQQLKLCKYFKDQNKSKFAYWLESISRKNIGFSAILFAQCMKFSLVFGIFDTVQMTINKNKQYEWIRSYIIPNLLIAGASFKLANTIFQPLYILARFKRAPSSQIRIHKDWNLRFVYKIKTYMCLLKQKDGEQNKITKQFTKLLKNQRSQWITINENFLRFGFRLAIYQYLKYYFYNSFQINIDQVNRQ